MRQILRISAYALLVDEGRILLCRLSPHISRSQEWTLPGGGTDFGEHPADAALREVFEETGYTISLLGAPYIDSQLMEFRGDAVHALRLIYRGEVVEGELRHEVDGSTDRCEWFNFEQTQTLPLVPLAELGIKLAAQS